MLELGTAGARVRATSLRGGLEIEMQILVRDQSGLAGEVLGDILDYVESIINTESASELGTVLGGGSFETGDSY